MDNIDKLWIVTFNPTTNQFDIDSVWGTIKSNLKMIINHREDCAEQEHWFTIFIHPEQSACQRFIDAIKVKIKTGNTPLEDWFIENGFWNFSEN
jgi:hypothetical protein